MSDVWRTGRKVGRTVYIGDELVGVMDTPELAEQVVRAVNIDRMATTTEHDTGCGSCSQHVRVNRLRAELNLISGGWESRVRLREEKDARLAEVEAANVELAGRLERTQVGDCGNASPGNRLAMSTCVDPSHCTLPLGHQGWHRDARTGARWGKEWSDPAGPSEPEGETGGGGR